VDSGACFRRRTACAVWRGQSPSRSVRLGFKLGLTSEPESSSSRIRLRFGRPPPAGVSVRLGAVTSPCSSTSRLFRRCHTPFCTSESWLLKNQELNVFPSRIPRRMWGFRPKAWPVGVMLKLPCDGSQWLMAGNFQRPNTPNHHPRRTRTRTEHPSDIHCQLLHCHFLRKQTTTTLLASATRDCAASGLGSRQLS
jgi:hypothetical protein